MCYCGLSKNARGVSGLSILRRGIRLVALAARVLYSYHIRIQGYLSTLRAQQRKVGTAQKLVNLLNFGVLLFVLFAEPVHFGMFVGVWRVVVRVRAFHV